MIMAKLLHIEASPRKERSASIAVAREFLDVYRASHKQDTVETIDLWSYRLPDFDLDTVNARYAILRGQDHTREQAAAWSRIREIFDHFASADKYLFSSPMWNFGVPYRLKQLVDVVTQPTMAFSFTEKDGYSGLVTGKSAVLILARTHSYHWGSGLESYDYQRTYLETWLHFIGFRSVRVIVVDPKLSDPHSGAVGRQVAIEQARELALKF